MIKKKNEKKLIEYAALWLSHKGMKPEQIAEELGVPVKSIKINQDVKQSDSRMSKLIINETAGKKIGGVAIMTKEASMLSDKVPNNKERNNSNIYRPRG